MPVQKDYVPKGVVIEPGYLTATLGEMKKFLDPKSLLYSPTMPIEHHDDGRLSWNIIEALSKWYYDTSYGRQEVPPHDEKKYILEGERDGKGGFHVKRIYRIPDTIEQYMNETALGFWNHLKGWGLEGQPGRIHLVNSTRKILKQIKKDDDSQKDLVGRLNPSFSF